MKKGMTLVETLVSLVILSLLLGAIFTILNLQSVRSSHVQKTSVLQTDAQVALTLLKWDLASSGLAFPKVDTAVRSLDGGLMGTDAISIKAVGLGFESSAVKWSWLLDRAHTTDLFYWVRGFEDTTFNFKEGDTVVCLDNDRKIMIPPGELTIIAPVVIDTFYDPKGNPVLGQQLTFDKKLSAIAGLVIIRKFFSLYNPGITLSINDSNQLVRGSDILLDNVEDLQFAYGIDNDGDNIIETWTDVIPQFATLGRKWAIRYTLVVTSRPMRDYTYIHNSLVIENHTYIPDKTRRRAILSGIIAPQNLQP